MSTIAQLKLYPVHFGIIDGIITAAGWMGVKWDRAVPRRPGFILAGRNIGETERAACRIMGGQDRWKPHDKGGAGVP